MNALPLFLATAEELSFSAAARRLGLSPSAAGKAISRLEAQLGVALFHRTTRRVRLTSEGELLLERARVIRDAWRDAEAQLAAGRDEPRGRLRVALPAIGHRLLAPHLPAFAAHYPHVELDLDLDDRIVDLAANRIDVSIRSGPLEDSTHHARRLGSFRFLLVAAPAYLAARGAPRSMAALAEHSQIRFRFPGSERLQPWRLANSLDGAVGAPSFACTSMEGVLAAALAGLGVAQAPEFLVADDIAQGRLIPVLPREMGEGIFWLVWPQSSHRAPKLRAFVDFCVGRLLPS
jgi:DNA-binding transcriptional LysR family regulator